MKVELYPYSPWEHSWPIKRGETYHYIKRIKQTYFQCSLNANKTFLRFVYGMIGRGMCCTWRRAEKRNQVLRLSLIVLCVCPILAKIKTTRQIIKVYVFWDITLCRFVYSDRCFGGACCFHGQEQRNLWVQRIHRNIVDIQSMVSYRRRPESSSPPM